jgi:hypothetical protein
VPLAQGFEEIGYPGEFEARNEARHPKVCRCPRTRTDLERLASEFDLKPPY